MQNIDLEIGQLAANVCMCDVAIGARWQNRLYRIVK
jgi:hypothetical protein